MRWRPGEQGQDGQTDPPIYATLGVPKFVRPLSTLAGSYRPTYASASTKRLILPSSGLWFPAIGAICGLQDRSCPWAWIPRLGCPIRGHQTLSSTPDMPAQVGSPLAPLLVLHSISASCLRVHAESRQGVPCLGLVVLLQPPGLHRSHGGCKLGQGFLVHTGVIRCGGKTRPSPGDAHPGIHFCPGPPSTGSSGQCPKPGPSACDDSPAALSGGAGFLTTPLSQASFSASPTHTTLVRVQVTPAQPPHPFPLPGTTLTHYHL